MQLLDYQDVPDDVNIKDFQDFNRTTSMRNISTIMEEECEHGANAFDAANQSQDLSRWLSSSSTSDGIVMIVSYKSITRID